MRGLIRGGAAELVSRDQILRRARGQGKIIFPIKLTPRSIGNLTRLKPNLLTVVTTIYKLLTKICKCVDEGKVQWLHKDDNRCREARSICPQYRGVSPTRTTLYSGVCLKLRKYRRYVMNAPKYVFSSSYGLYIKGKMHIHDLC